MPVPEIIGTEKSTCTGTGNNWHQKKYLYRYQKKNVTLWSLQNLSHCKSHDVTSMILHLGFLEDEEHKLKLWREEELQLVCSQESPTWEAAHPNHCSAVSTGLVDATTFLIHV